MGDRHLPTAPVDQVKHRIGAGAGGLERHGLSRAELDGELRDRRGLRLMQCRSGMRRCSEDESGRHSECDGENRPHRDHLIAQVLVRVAT